MEEVSRLKKSLSGLKGRLKVIAKDLTKACGTEHESLLMEEIITSLEALATKARKTQDELESSLPEEEIEREVENYMAMERTIRELRVEARRRLKKPAEDQPARVKGTENDGSSAPVLPKWNLPKFDGNVLLFTAFWDQFEAGVHSRSDIGDVTKFVYLRTCLEGAALNAIAGYSVTGANYNAAVTTLKSRFGRPKLIAEKHILELVQMEKCTRPTVTELRRLHDGMSSNVRALVALNKDPNNETLSAAEVLLAVLKQKLPTIVRKRWENKALEGNPEETTLEAFFEFLQTQLEIEETVSMGEKEVGVSRIGVKANELKPGQRRTWMSSAAALQASVQEKKGCSFCSGEHDNVLCQRFNNADNRERWKLVREKRLCFLCLLPGHTTQNCDRKAEGRRHHPKLQANVDIRHTSEKTNVQVGMTTVHANGTILLQTALAVLQNEFGDRTVVMCLLDAGSQRSFITKELADRMNLKGTTEFVAISTVGGQWTEGKRLRRVRFALKAADNDDLEPKQWNLMEALCLPKICSPLQANPSLSGTWKHLHGLKLADQFPRESLKVDVLIGLDYYYEFVQREVRSGSANEPTAVRTSLGWIVCGRMGENDIGQQVQSLHVKVCENPHDGLRRFWELETLGIQDSHLQTESHSSKEMEHFVNTVTYDGERYVVRLPWKAEGKLPNNYQYALKRLEQTETRLQNNRSNASTYVNEMKEHFSNDWAEVAPDQRPALGKEWYLPHHAVIRRDKPTTSCRIVFDGSAKFKGISLNDQLESGPSLQKELAAILIRFRRFRIGLHADVKRMFLQIGLHEADRDVVRFLWRDLNHEIEPLIYRFKRVCFGLKCSPFLALAVVQHHVQTNGEKFKTAKEELLHNMYVDDLVTSCDTEMEAKAIMHDATDLMKQGGFSLTRWVSNSTIIEGTVDRNGARNHTETTLKVLGMLWDYEKDTLTLRLPRSQVHKADTKRQMLKIIAKVFDPLGLLAPFVIVAKVLMQKLWQKGTGWDELVPNELKRAWTCWKRHCSITSTITVDRSLKIVPDTEVMQLELHTFCDASQSAYGTVVYLKSKCNNGVCSVNIVAAKSRVAPIKRLTLPRLELLAALLGARLTFFVKTQLKLTIRTIHYWSDSEITLTWIKNNPNKWKPFVRNRVLEILHLTDPLQWRYCPTKHNPADLLSRGCSLQNLKRDTNWWNGPAWLMKEEHVWPSPSTNKSQAEESEPETLLCLHAVDEMEGISLAEKYGNFDRLIRITAICLRFADNCRCPQQLRRVGPMTTIELRNAQSVWFRIVQREAFPKEIERLRSLKGLPEDNKIYKLDPFLSEDRLIRMKGRIEKADLPYNARHPIILPHNHVVVDLLIRHCHERQLHAGTEHTLAVLRQGFWILKARSAVKRIIKDCRICRRFTSTNYTQQMAPLPEDRITQAYPFERTGLDFAGPLYVKRGRSVKKVYICLFTCMTIRAIHLELVTDMSTGQFLLAFRRFVARRGNPTILQSDNSKTFKAADRELRQLFNRQSINEIRRELCSKGVTWKFITERAPWTGGYWERLVRSVKTPLRKVLGHALLTEQELTTVLTEVEARVNSRPLTFIGEDPKDMNVLTPFHFLIGREFRALPDHVATEESAIMIPRSGDEMRQRWRYQQRLVAHFWKRWRNEYITTLATRNKWCGTRTPPMVGDIVLIAEENVPRTRWSMGKIVEVLPGSDGMVRSVRLRTIRGIITRPIAKLHLIEQGTAL